MITASWNSQTGDRLSFTVYTEDAEWNPVAGIYMMCGRHQNGTWIPFYIGKTVNFKDRLCDHDQWVPAVRLGATHVHAALVPTQSESDRLEKLLIAEFNPPLNVHHKRQGIVEMALANGGLLSSAKPAPAMNLLLSVAGLGVPRPADRTTPFNLANMASLGLPAPRNPPPATNLLASALGVGKRTI